MILIIILFTISFLLFFGAIYYINLSQASVSYPPKRVLYQKASIFGIGGVLFLVISLLFLL
ncbi:hypothetical protein LC087_00960 [Bacillus carboniphilus]|uniref:Preprotein translocase subunit SecG n=1 Tax=Bacillus carboniphilus TaxID=86663 RepID=A0ABY9JX10_9BACI|nr:hypothetical protein [Bacillus carboniphilus]WLR42843.1 hypothetical protein LC087_00960 [Bacillus carboniphilus]